MREHRTPTENGQLHNNPQKTSFYIGSMGALLILTSVSLPWSQLMGSQVYLPSSLPTLMAGSLLFSISTFTFFMSSLLAHATAILAWLSITAEKCAKRKPAGQLIATVSALVAFASTVILVQAGWSLSWGSLLIIAGAVLMLVSTFTVRGK
jgi:hypothetical protein